ncbi:MAG: aromatic acid exporter family protein [Xenococcaceae cyanobacterium]
MATNVNRYILKLALGAALAYAVGNALHSRRITYVLYGSILCMHPIAGDTVGYVIDKLKSAALGATYGIMLDSAFQGNTYVTLPLGLTSLMATGYWFGIPKRVLIFSGIVFIMAVANPTYTTESTNYIGLRFWNIFLGSAVGIAVNIALWPNPDTDKLDPAFAKAIASIGKLYDMVINDYRQGSLATNAQSRKQLRVDIEEQLGVIDSLLGNAKNELWSPFTNDAPYQRWIALPTRIESLFVLVADLGLALEGGDSDRLYWSVQAELENLIQETRATFERFSQVATFRSSQPFDNPLANLPALNQAISDRLSQIDTADNLPTELAPDEIKRVSASIYGLRAIASELNDLAGAQ